MSTEEKERSRKLKRNIITATQKQMLSMNQDIFPNLQNSYTPYRNYHTFSVLPHDDDNIFYFFPNYSYLKNSVLEYEPAFSDDKQYSDVNKYSIFSIDEDDLLTIQYQTNQEDFQDTYNIYSFLEEDKILTISNSIQSEELEDKYSVFSIEDTDLEDIKTLIISYNI